MKKIFILAPAIALTIALHSCQIADKKSAESKDSVAGDTSKIAGSYVAGSESTKTGLDDAGATFLKQAAVAETMQIEAAKYAKDHAASQNVKDFATKIFDEHSQVNKELKDFAISKKVITADALPAEVQIRFDEMKKLKGAAFDKAYMGMVVAEHEKAVTLYTEGMQNKDADLKEWATKTLNTLKTHSTHAKDVTLALK